MASYGNQVIAGILLLIIFSSGGVVAQTEENVILELTSISLQSERSFLTEIIFSPYETYRITSDIFPTDETIIEPLIRIRISSDTNSITRVHRGDSKYGNSTFVPYTHQYLVNVTNMGLLPVITFNLTILQTSDSRSNPFAQEIVLQNALIALVIITIIPLGIIYLGLVGFRKRQIIA
ncbi:MAG: hypothetical protein E4H14_00450 [Candidatus Thorarchaeota archaeon]|nr:MAG: hypothetical protein E4H14_00450 [Candidatus Thorarchaeota archaeon]